MDLPLRLGFHPPVFQRFVYRGIVSFVGGIPSCPLFERLDLLGCCLFDPIGGFAFARIDFFSDEVSDLIFVVVWVEPVHQPGPQVSDLCRETRQFLQVVCEVVLPFVVEFIGERFISDSFEM